LKLRRRIALVLALALLFAVVPTMAKASPGVVHLDGCSGWNDWSSVLVPERTWFYDFTEACRRHDIAYAYRTYGPGEAGRWQADYQFLLDMRANCQSRKGWWERTWCFAAASEYAGAVRKFGGRFYNSPDPNVRAQVPLRYA
jgi:hypothetical protein